MPVGHKLVGIKDQSIRCTKRKKKKISLLDWLTHSLFELYLIS
jgi:hypothetical protein